MRKTTKVLSVIACLLLNVSLLLGVIFVTSFNHRFYAYEYAKNNQAETIGMSNEDLMHATEVLLDYLNDTREDIVVEANVYGNQREVFNERETMHMVDVKVLCMHAKTFGIVAFVLAVIVLAYIAFQQKKACLLYYAYGFKISLCILLACITCISIYAIFDFYDFWMQFHYLFFDNDLFILDPNTSIMINMFPQSFFFDLVMLIVGIYVCLIACIFACITYLKRKVLV